MMVGLKDTSGFTLAVGRAREKREGGEKASGNSGLNTVNRSIFSVVLSALSRAELC